MHGAVPLVRTVAAAIPQPPSRIPHINFHILQRRTKALRPRNCPRIAVQQPRRPHSTAAHAETIHSSTRVYDGEQDHDALAVKTQWRSFRKIGSQGESVQKQADIGTRTDIPISESLTINETELDDINIYALLEQGNAAFLQLAVLNETIGTPFLRHASDDDFEKALQMLDPSRMIVPEIVISRHKPPVGGWKATDARGMGDITASLTYCRSLLKHMIYTRRGTGKQLPLNAYRYLMRWAATMRDHNFASELEQCMLEDKVRPDLDCHNYFLEAKVWNNTVNPSEKFHLRVYPYNLRMRSFRPRLQRHTESHKGYDVANAKEGIIGLRQEVLARFQQIVQSKYTPNEATFASVMTAMGREGDLEGVHSILKSVWNIDMVQLELYGEDEIQAPTFYEAASHLRPSQKLLFTVVHIFGSNNDVHTAWTLLDYISRSYDLSISKETWRELLEWHLVLSCNRSPSRQKYGQRVGYVEPFVFERLFASMIDKPYNVQPDTAVLFMLSRVRETERRFAKSLEALEMLRAIWQQTSTELKDVVLRLRQKLDEMAREDKQSPWNWTALMDLRQEFLDASLKWDCGLRMMQHAVTEHVLRSRAWQSGVNSKMPRHWEHRWVPAIVQEYKPFLRKTLSYSVRTGNVHLRDMDVQSRPDFMFSRQSIEGSSFDQEVRRLRAHLQVTNHRDLFRNMGKLQAYDPIWYNDPNDDFSNPEASMLRSYNPRRAAP